MLSTQYIHPHSESLPWVAKLGCGSKEFSWPIHMALHEGDDFFKNILLGMLLNYTSLQISIPSENHIFKSCLLFPLFICLNKIRTVKVFDLCMYL